MITLLKTENGWPMVIRFSLVAGGGFEPPTSGL